MKKYLTIFAFVIIIISIFTFSALASTVYTSTELLDEISSAGIAPVKIVLGADIELSSETVISKESNITVDTNGYQIKFTGTGSAFVLKNKNSTFNLKGSNKLQSYKMYSHYSDSVKADMLSTGTGYLFDVIHGTLNVSDAYLYGKGGAHVIYSTYTDNNSTAINAKNSVLRVPENSAHSAISVAGLSGGSTVKLRALALENCVEYGGFYGQSYNFNLTVGSSFTNVKFYDFYIKNDCWYDVNNPEISALSMNSYESALPITSCIFNTYAEQTGSIKLYTETGKQNLRLYDCTFSGLTSGGKITGDRGGNAVVYLVITPSTCTQTGRMQRALNGTEFSSEETAPVIWHSYTVKKLSYPNGYSQKGVYTLNCSKCNAPSDKTESAPEIFTNLGYASKMDETAIALGMRINQEMLDELLLAYPNTELQIGAILADGETEVTIKNGNVTVSNGYAYVYQDKKGTVVEVKKGEFTSSNKDEKFTMELFVNDGTSIEYVEPDLDYLSYNEIKQAMNEGIQKEIDSIVGSKIKLTYNDDGSFRVLVIADAHMNVNSDATKVQSVKDRIKMLVDRVNPNLVIFTGDNTINSSSEALLRANIDALVGYIEQKQIPWCHVYGNHDHEGALSNKDQQPIWESYDYCVSKTGEDLSGTGNYVLGVYNKDGSLGSVVYCIDSGAYSSLGGYDYIKEDQIEWYENTSIRLEELAGKTVPGIMAFHIPLIENNTAHDNRFNSEIVYESSGGKNENICSSNTDTELLETIFKRKDIKAIVTGHDHVNDYMYNYLGVKLCSSPNISDLTYTNSALQGSRIFDLNLETIDDIPTRVEYIIERLDSSDYEPHESGSCLISGEEEELEYVVQGLDGGSLSGALNVYFNQDGKMQITRSSSGNSEVFIALDEEKFGTIGDNKYLIVWMDLSNVGFRKACMGFTSNLHFQSPYRTDNYDTKSEFYYLADGSDKWVTLYHGSDGCFGSGDNGSQEMYGKKGYFAFNLSQMLNGNNVPNKDTLITGIYMYLDVNYGAGKSFYISDIRLVDDYRTI